MSRLPTTNIDSGMDTTKTTKDIFAYKASDFLIPAGFIPYVNRTNRLYDEYHPNSMTFDALSSNHSSAKVALLLAWNFVYLSGLAFGAKKSAEYIVANQDAIIKFLGDMSETFL